MPEPVLVVDLGSSAVSAALVVDGQVRLMKEPGGNALRWPSSLCADADGLLLGTKAEQRKRAAPAGYVSDVRARAVDPSPLVAGDRSLTGPDVVAEVFADLRAEVERLNGAVLTRLTLTVPVAWPPGHPGRDMLVAAGEAAGFLDVDLLAEPVAATLDPESGGSAAPAVGTLVLVCDVGAYGAVTLVRFTGPSRADIVQHRLVPGGAELDRLMLDRIGADDRSGVEPLLTADGDDGLRGRFDAYDFVRRLRHQLSDSEQAEDSLTLLDPPYPLSRATLEGFVQPVLNDLVDGCRAVLSTAPASVPNPGCVVFAGGLARMPILSDVVRHAVPSVPINLSRQPELAVVRGAARWTVLSATRQVKASAQQRWRAIPLIWTVPDGTARLLQWTMQEGERFEPDSVLAIARADDDTLLDITVQRAGILLERRLAPGADLSGALAAVAQPDRLPVDPLLSVRVADIEASAIELGPELDTFIELGGNEGTQRGPHRIKVRRFEGDLAILNEETLDSGSGILYKYGVFRGPNGVPVLVAHMITSPGNAFVVVDLFDVNPILTFHDPTDPFTFMVNENDWNLVTRSIFSETPSPNRNHWWRNVFSGPAKKDQYRSVVWSLAEEGRWRNNPMRVAQMTDVEWKSMYDARRFTRPEESQLSGFTEQATSPDGQLSAQIDGQNLIVQQVPSGKTLFSAPLPGGEGHGVAFNADGTYLAARTKDHRFCRVRVWQL